jgi:rhamnose utilization protein RhaD (predicted bifunctional aldolase and dehydrogenase)
VFEARGNWGTDLDKSAPEELTATAAELGVDPLLIQGAGGNASVKIGDALWVKASGTWMRDAVLRNIFAYVSLAPLLTLRDNGEFEAMDALLQSGRAGNGLRPSIETSLHALMPHAAVVHAHAVNSVAVSVLGDGQSRFKHAMGRDIRGIFIPYTKPGVPLARAVAEALATRGPADVLLLQNHGVVVGADRPRTAADLLREVERRLTLPVRSLPKPDITAARAWENKAYRLAEAQSGAALDPFLFEVLTRAPLTPDQVVFLGGAVSVMAPAAESGGAAPLIFKAGVGAFRRRECTPGALSMIDALLDVAVRLPEGAQVLGLTASHAAELLDWEAEKYRKSLDGP